MNRSSWKTTASLLAIAALLALLTACATKRGGPRQGSIDSAEPTTRLAKSGAQLWAKNCARCHNFRSPGTYNDAQWDIAVHHMRIRANLTGEDSRKVLTFLQAGN